MKITNKKSKCPYLGLYLELKVDVRLESHVKIYYKSYIPFVCERFEKFLIKAYISSSHVMGVKIQGDMRG